MKSSLPSIDGTNVFSLSPSTLPIQPLPSLRATEQYPSCHNRANCMDQVIHWNPKPNSILWFFIYSSLERRTPLFCPQIYPTYISRLIDILTNADFHHSHGIALL